MKSCFLFGHANCPDTIICYAKHIGNARNLLEYANRRREDQAVIENLVDPL